MMTKKEFEDEFRRLYLPALVEREQGGSPDKPGRRQAWNDLVEGYIKDGRLPERAGDWSHPRWLERSGPKGRSSNPRCGRDEIPVRRKGYTRKDGTKVAPTTYCAEDQGKPGRTAYGAKGGPHSRKKGYEPWIQEKGSLGNGFLTSMSFEQQKKAVKRAFSAEKKQHGGDYVQAYRSTLGKIMVLNRSTDLRRKYGSKITKIRDWFAKEYGEGSKRWPKRAANIGVLKNRLIALPPHLERGRRPNPEKLTDQPFDSAQRVGEIQYRLAPIDVGFDLRAQGMAVDLGDDDPLRVSYEIDGERRVIEGPRDGVITRLREAGYTIA